MQVGVGFSKTYTKLTKRILREGIDVEVTSSKSVTIIRVQKIDFSITAIFNSLNEVGVIQQYSTVYIADPYDLSMFMSIIFFNFDFIY